MNTSGLLQSSFTLQETRSIHDSVTTTGPIVKSIVSLTADPEVASLIPTQYHTFMELDHKVISMGILLLHLIHEGYVVVSYKCVQEVLVICFKSSLPRKKL